MRHASFSVGDILNAAEKCSVAPVARDSIYECKERLLHHLISEGYAERHVVSHIDNILKLFFSCSDMCESPIEQMVLAALILSGAGELRGPAVYHWKEDPVWPDCNFAIAPQFPIGRYRLDFLVRFKVEDWVCAVAIECDGKDFHEGSEAKKNDAIRDGYLANIGVQTLRYSGRYIYKNLDRIQRWPMETIESRCP